MKIREINRGLLLYCVELGDDKYIPSEKGIEFESIDNVLEVDMDILVGSY